MSNDEIIRNWKTGRDAEVAGDDAPANPAGDVQLSEEELEAVAGGGDTEESTLECTGSQTVCKGTCCFPPLDLGCCEMM